jgi:hypothetical protein
MSFAWSASEVYLSELVNRARANPTAEGVRLGIDLTVGLTSAEAARLVPQEPLALNQYLTAAARAHSLDMATRNFFDHVNPDGQSPTDRAHAAGYGGTAGENIAGGYSTLDAVHQAWMESVGHRKNVLSLYSNFDSSFHYDEFGPGIAMAAGGAYDNYYTEMFGYQGVSPSVYILGVMFNDADNNDFYGIGEGASGVRIDVALQSAPNSVVATYTTDAAGNYQLAVASGAYNVTFTRISDGRKVTKTATVSGQNVKVDAETGQLTLPSSPDDYANQGQWVSAGVITLDPTLGNGAQLGALENPGDTDLFRFIATKTGTTTITLSHPTGQFALQLNAYDGANTLIATGTAGGDFGNGSVATFTVIAGQSYYLLARPVQSASVGAYVITIQGPTTTVSDDFADIGELSTASPITLDAATGDGSKVGYLESVGDTDLFKLVMPRTGSVTITLGHPEGAFGSQLRVFDSNGQEIHLGAAGGDFGTDSSVTFAVVEGETYYISAEASNGTSRGVYLVQIAGPGPVDPEPRPVNITLGHVPAAESLVTSIIYNGKLTLVFTNGWSQPLLASPNDDGSWSWYDIRGDVADPVVDGDIVTWKDRREGLTYCAMRGLDGLILFREDTPGVWSHRNLTDEITNAMSISADIELIFDPMGRAMLAGLSDGGELIIYSQTLKKPTGQYKWTFRNVTALDVETKGLEMPFATSELVSWVTGALTCNIAFLDDTGAIQLFYKPKGVAKWTLQNLSAVTGTGPLVGELTVFQTPRNQGVHISGTDEFGHLWVTSYTRLGGWWGRDLTSRLNGYAFGIRTLASYQNKSGVSFVVGIKADGNLSLYRYMATRNAWAKVDINLTPPDFRNMAGRLSVAVNRTSGEINIVGTLDSFHLVRWTWRPGEGWNYEDVSYKLAEAT